MSAADSTPRSAGARARLALPALLVASIIASLGLGGARRAHVVPDAELDAVAAAVRERFATGDVIVSEPPWAAGVQARLGDLAMLPSRGFDAADVRGFRRVFLVELAMAGTSDAVAAALARRGTLEPVATLPRARVSLVTLRHPEQAVVDLWRDLERARVWARYAGSAAAVACDRLDDDRWLCPRDADWSWVGREVGAIGNAPHACVWAHPLAPGGVLRIELPAAPPSGRGRELALAYGFLDEAWARARAPVAIRVVAGEREVWRGERPPSEGLARASIPLDPAAETIALELETTYEHGAHFCVSATVLEPTEGP